MTQKEENMLISRFIVYNDHKSFEKLLAYHQNGIMNLLLKLTNFDEFETKDLFQETCTKIFKNIKKFRGSAGFSSWAYRIAYNTFLNNVKKKGNFEKLKERQSLGQEYTFHSSQDARLDMEKMIMILRPEEKAAMQLSYIQGFSHSDIAVILECPIGTVKSLIKRGKERIASAFKHYNT